MSPPKLRIEFRDDGRVDIHLRTETRQTTIDTISRIGITGTMESDLSDYTLLKLLAFARTGALPEIEFRAHARYHGFVTAPDDPEDVYVRLNVGGLGYEVSRSILISGPCWRANFRKLSRPRPKSLSIGTRAPVRKRSS